MAATEQGLHASLKTIILHATETLRERLKNTSSFSETDLRSCLDDVKSVSKLLASLDQFSGACKITEAQEELLCNIVKDICFPLLYSLYLLPESEKKNSEKGRALSLLVSLILESCRALKDQSLPSVVIQLLIPLCTVTKITDDALISLANNAYHSYRETPLNQYLSLELFGALLTDDHLFKRFLSNISLLGLSKEDMLVHLFNITVCCVEEDSAFSKAFTIVPKLFAFFPEELRRKCEDQIWMCYTQPIALPSGLQVNKQSLWKSLYVFFCLKNYFFPLEAVSKDILAVHLASNNFWFIIQVGLISLEPLHRKLAVYLLKRLIDTCEKNACTVNVLVGPIETAPIFWWSPSAKKELSAVWEDFILMIEVLEEKQVHIIKPLLSRMHHLIKATSENSKEGHLLFHSSWLVTIVTRCFDHDSHFMSRWGAHTLLTLNFQEVPLVQHGQLKFLSHDLLIHLQENKLYSRYEGTELGKCSPVGEALKDFFAHLFVCLDKEQKVDYLGNLLRIVCENNWGSIPLLFVFEGLSLIPVNPVIDSNLLQLVRQILQSCLITHESITRGAIQCFICQMLLNLVDKSSVTLNEMMCALAPLNREESFQRGTPLWNSTLSWLGQAVEEKTWTADEASTQALGFLKDPHSASSSVSVEGYKVVAMARMLLLYADLTEQKSQRENVKNQLSLQNTQSERAAAEKVLLETLAKSPLGITVEEICHTFAHIRTRAYIDVGRVNRSLSLFYSLLKEASALKTSAVDIMLKRNCNFLFKDVSHFVKARISQELTAIGDLDQIKFYSDVLLSLGLNSEHVQTEITDILTFATHVFDKSKDVPSGEAVEKIDVLVTSCTRMLKALCKLMEARLQQSSEAGTKSGPAFSSCQALVACVMSLQSVPQPFSRKRADTDAISRARLGQAISSYINCKWHCRRFLFSHSFSQQSANNVLTELVGKSADLIDVEQMLNAAMEDLSIGSGRSDVAIYRALGIIMSEIVAKANSEVVSKFLELSWSKVMEEKKNRLFWKKLESLVPLALHPAILSQDPTSVIGESLDQFFNNMQTLGTDKTGVMYLVYEHLCEKSLTKENDTNRQLAMRLIPLLVEGTVFGQLHKRGERLWLDVCAYLENIDETSCVSQLTSSMSKDDLYTRVAVLNWLSKLSPSNMMDVKFVLAFLEHLKAKYLTLAKLTTYKQFSNSLSHRQKHRMVLVFVLLADFIKEDMCEQYLSTLWYCLEIECHPSVRQNLEWLVLILLRKYPKLVDSVWDVFKLYSNRRSVCLCSIFFILCHIGKNLPQQLKTEFYEQALTSVLPWSMARHFNTRLFAQMAMVKLWQQCQALHLETLTSRFSLVQPTVDYILNNGNACNNVVKLIQNYMFQDFDPVADYSMETLFYTLPKLAGIADDEWISPSQFLKWDKTWLSRTGNPLPLRNSTQTLSQCKTGPWKLKVYKENDDENSETADNTGDIQKKIMPWRQLSPDQDTEAELTSIQRCRGQEDGLILVTSLIDKVPNLGGLCRTSEIFGVSEFVIGNLSYLEDRMFQSLSVSAQKWINITEVMKPKVPEYLEEKRAQGYTLVGVEQTANSISLQEYKFPKKTLLLLGNEKEGIPVDVLQSLDVCVEIPQLGIIRSLNVHVCGALIVWEYTRQLLQQPEAEQREGSTNSQLSMT
ncbi:tar (hiv-1) RNA binding protein 1 [Plakobranchus ocellatus]|uniref:tRNA (guanosine(18)-2'-O)-methyltransferase TARBP1 n=1 Tax=Plakobranchus ocellatus TaxID=259542 RepID=A0AAV3ZT98_9GAST|nr:tar (hiv-1) RNA binding protein 1 [Plakobranchus ocellatus]